MQISPLLSKGIDFCRTILCIQIVFFHMATTAPIAQENLADGTIYGYIIKFITMMNNLAVPMFYAISGYLFALSYQPTWQDYTNQAHKKTVRLIQPILIWTSLFLLLYYIAQAMPSTAHLFSGTNKLIADYDWTDVLDAYAGIKSGFPFAGQYWFLRNLFVMCLAFPLIAWLFKHTRFTGLLLLFIGCYALRFFNQFIADTIIFFSVGAWLATNDKVIAYIAAKRTSILASLFTMFTIIAFVGHTIPSLGWLYQCVFYFFILTGFATISKVVLHLLHKGIGKKVLLLSEGSFFIFLIHLQLLMFIKRVAYKTMHADSAPEVLILFFIVPVIVIIMSYLLYFLLKKWMPGLLDVMTGKAGLFSTLSKKTK